MRSDRKQGHKGEKRWRSDVNGTGLGLDGGRRRRVKGLKQEQERREEMKSGSRQTMHSAVDN